MRLEGLTEHQTHLFGGVIILVILFFGLLGLMVFLDRRGVKTYLSRPEKPKPRRERRREKKLLKSKK